MTGFVRQLVSRLLADDRKTDGEKLSRNRHFEVFDDPQGRAAHRTYRRLRSLVHDIQAAGAKPLSMDRREGERSIRLQIPLPHCVRTAYLSEDELDLLREVCDFGGKAVS